MGPFEEEDEDGYKYSYEAHLESIISEGVEYMLLLFLRHDAKTGSNAETAPFFRRMIRVLRACADQMEIKTAFFEEKIEEGLTDEEAQEEFLKDFFGEDNPDE